MMPETSGINRGYVVLHEKLTQAEGRFPVGSVGPARFSGTVFAGNYDVGFETGSGYLTGLPVQAKTDIAQGCFSTHPCAASAADLTGRWELTARGGGPGTLEIIQSGNELRGSLQSVDGISSVLTGRRTGDAIELQIQDTLGGCSGPMTVSLTTGCSMSGLGDANSTCGGPGFATRRFEAVR